MKKAINGSLFLFIIISFTGYFIYNGLHTEDKLYIIDQKINKLQLINKDLNIYIKNSIKYEDFNDIQGEIDLYKKGYRVLINNKIFKNIKIDTFQTLLDKIDKNILNKIDILEKLKSYRAILNNSFRIMEKLKIKGIDKKFNSLNFIIMTLDKNPNIDIKTQLSNLANYKASNIYEKYFLKHAKTILKYQLKYNNSKLDIKKLEIDKKLNSIHKVYKEYIKRDIHEARVSIIILFITIFILVIIYLVYSYRFIAFNKELLKFKTAVQNSDNIIVITDKNQIIKYVNDAFIKSTGFSYSEVIGKKPSILKTTNTSKEFYKNLNETIYSGKKWCGKFTNKDKFGNIFYETASIVPIFDDNGDIEEFIAIKLDITKETLITKELELKKQQIENMNQNLEYKVEEKTKELQNLNENLENKIKEAIEKSKIKDQQMLQQSRLAQMGEMMSMIAHQWRQPLAAISATSNAINLKARLNKLDKDTIIKLSSKIDEYSQHLSSTINDFRDFFKPNKEKKETTYDEVIKSVLNIVEISIVNKNIQIIKELNSDIVFNTHPNELKQVVLNLIKNAEDVLLDNKIENPTITIETKDNILTVSDNGGGIPEDIIDKIFDPYFSTKTKKDGTGLGLYMSKSIIDEHCGGKLSVSNGDEGAVFKIELNGEHK